jgi:hypothetical protein
MRNTVHHHEQLATGTTTPTPADRNPDWATRASTARILTWTSDRVFDDGDSHEKGELSLCVGEAA